MNVHPKPEPPADPLIDSLTAAFRAALIKLRQQPVRGGRKVTVHIAEGWASAYIELPPEFVPVGRESRKE